MVTERFIKSQERRPFNRHPARVTVGVIEAVWEVVYADGVREMHESALIRKLCGLLHLEDRDVGLARQRVVARLGTE